MAERGLNFRQRVLLKELMVAIVGPGYVGLPPAAGVACAGVSVSEIDVDAERVARLVRGEHHIPDNSTATLSPPVEAHNGTAPPGSRLRSILLDEADPAAQDCLCDAVALNAFGISWILTCSRLLVDATGVTRRFPSAAGPVIRL